MPPLPVLLDGLSDTLSERIRLVGGEETDTLDGEYVLVWMRVAVRASENPALDVALELGRRLDRPVFVIHALSERYPSASDRHHTFILEGAADVATELADRGIGTAFHLEREGHRGPHLKALAERAALVVTEEFPLAPLSTWTRRLAEAAPSPVLAVDTSCIVPLRLAPATDRAFRFRDRTARLRDERVRRPWVDAEPVHPPFVPKLPFEPVPVADLSPADRARLIGSCRIDHTVGPVPHTPGGSGAGLARWNEFLAGPLERYARDRNDPLRSGVSRMSPYLHYGMVSPFRLARDAAASEARGAAKYLDELLVWRELAWAWCFHHPDPPGPSHLPDWARRTLADHESDPRPLLPSWETLARARTGDELWDAAQTSLVRHGELHNNVRMTWGKALLAWTRDAAEALEVLEDLNHRFALDGRDPASWGGILWCLGLFDRPFPPEKPILGTVRPRSTASHARRLDPDRFRRRVERPVFPDAGSVLVIGAGLAGLTCARTLADHGLDVRVVDKGSRPGGRLATRVLPEGTFDHGAQYFTARDERFRLRVRSWARDGIVAPWEGRVRVLEDGEIRPTEGTTRRWVGAPEMNRLAAHLAEGLDVRTERRIEHLVRDGNRWRATDSEGRAHEAATVVVALPAPQAVPLLGEAPALREAAARARMSPTWAVLVELAEPWPLELDGAFVHASPLSWIARDGSKPGRPSGDRWVLHGSAEWSRVHLEDEPDSVADALLDALRTASGTTLPPVREAHAHRWRHAGVERPLGRECLWSPTRRIGIAGDWCPASRVEGAWLSGAALAGEILRDAGARVRARGSSREST